jgi:hypothetical protein
MTAEPLSRRAFRASRQINKSRSRLASCRCKNDTSVGLYVRRGGGDSRLACLRQHGLGVSRQSDRKKFNYVSLVSVSRAGGFDEACEFATLLAGIRIFDERTKPSKSRKDRLRSLYTRSAISSPSGGDSTTGLFSSSSKTNHSVAS